MTATISYTRVSRVEQAKGDGGASMTGTTPETLYKYMGYGGAKATLQNMTVKLSKPAAFNDPFDIVLEDALGLDVEEFIEGLIPAMFDLMTRPDLDYASLRRSQLGTQIALIHSRLKGRSPEYVARMRADFLNTPAT